MDPADGRRTQRLALRLAAPRGVEDRQPALEADEDAPDARPRTFLDEVGKLMAERVHLDEESQLQFLDLAQMNDPIEDHLPILIARKIIIGNEKAAQSLRHILPDDLLDVVRRAEARLAALHVDDGAERALIRTAAAEIGRASCRERVS